MLPAPKRFEKRPGSAYVLDRAATIVARMGDVEDGPFLPSFGEQPALTAPATGRRLPAAPSVDEWFATDDHLARRSIWALALVSRRAWSAAHHPAVLLGLLIDGCANGVHASRNERAI